MRRIWFDVDGGRVSALRWDNPGAPQLVFAHANGFNAQTYRQMLTRLSKDFEVTAPDTRGQGLSEAPIEPSNLRDWHIYASDLSRICHQLDDRPRYLAGHSMGACCALLAAAFHNARPVRMAFIEPIFMPTGFYAIPHIPGGAYLYRFNPMSSAAKRRRSLWPDRDEAKASYRNKRLFSDWAPGVLDDYLETGLVPRGDQFELACSKELEAANFASHGHDPWAALNRVGPDIPMLQAGLPGSTVYTAWRLRRRGVPLERAADLGHLAPMTHPERCADWYSTRLLAVGSANV